MSFSRTYSAQTNMLDGTVVGVESDLSFGLFSFSIVGLPDKAVEEAKDRVNSAIKNSGLQSPKSKNQKITVSLQPAELKKAGSIYDLPICLSYLLSSKQINFDPSGKIFLGELSLNGDLKPIKGALPLTLTAKKAGFKEVFLPYENASEAALVDGIDIKPIKNLKQVILHLNKNLKEDRLEITTYKKQKTKDEDRNDPPIDFSEIKGQEAAKRALEIAAAGQHNVLLTGPPGTGKTMLAKAFIGILPKLSENQSLETTSIHSIAGELKNNLIAWPPFRSPHHTSSHVAIVGGGNDPKPGEITLAHNGVLFMDEFPEFPQKAIESLRQPMEEGHITISRAKAKSLFPANFILIAAMNPCPCGNFQNNPDLDSKDCICKPSDIVKYQRKISGPIADRFDIWVNVDNVDYKKLSEKSQNKSKSIQEKIKKARQKQKDRLKDDDAEIVTNSQLSSKQIEEKLNIEKEALEILRNSSEKLKLSPRVYYKTIKIAQTIADLGQKEFIGKNEILEALQYRPKEEY